MLSSSLIKIGQWSKLTLTKCLTIASGYSSFQAALQKLLSSFLCIRSVMHLRFD